METAMARTTTISDTEVSANRRKKALGMLTAGVSQAEIARQLGVSRQAVHHWVVRLRLLGPDDMIRVRQRGRPSLPPLDLPAIAASSAMAASSASA
jgi:biotin operon repressor